MGSRTYRERNQQIMKIPFLSNKWSPKKTPMRKSQSLNNLVNLDPQQRQREFGIDAIDQPTTFRIAKGPTLKFVNGKWIADGNTENGGNQQALDSAAASQEMVQLRTDVQRLNDENNMLQ